MLHTTDLRTKVSQVRRRILLIEDNPGDVRLIQEAIKASGYDIDLYVLTDASEAIAYLQNNRIGSEACPKPDLILLDLNLPKIDGREILAMVRQDEKLKTIPVIILTISQAEEDINQCYTMYCNCYIRKPFEIDQLIQLIDCIIIFWFGVVTLPP